MSLIRAELGAINKWFYDQKGAYDIVLRRRIQIIITVNNRALLLYLKHISLPKWARGAITWGPSYIKTLPTNSVSKYIMSQKFYATHLMSHYSYLV